LTPAGLSSVSSFSQLAFAGAGSMRATVASKSMREACSTLPSSSPAIVTVSARTPPVSLAPASTVRSPRTLTSPLNLPAMRTLPPPSILPSIVMSAAISDSLRGRPGSARTTGAGVGAGAGARAGASIKGGTLIIGGDAGYMTGFMMQKGVIVICGNAGEALADSMYEGVIYVGGEVASFGNDTIVEEPTADDDDFLNGAFTTYGIERPRRLRKIVAGRKLWNFEHAELETWRHAL
jgi:hypothetical protein